MNNLDLFSLALGLQSPWILTSVKLEEGQNKQKELHISISHSRGSQFIDESGVMCGIHDTKERVWRHLNFFEHECYIHCNVPRIKTSLGQVKQVITPWARPESGFTLLFEAFAMYLIECEMPVSKVGELLKEYAPKIWRIFNYWIKKAYQEADHTNITKLGIDETSTKKGHNYITLAVDLDTRAVIFATPGKDSQTITGIKDYLETKNVPSNQIKEASIDLSPAFISGVTSSFENAKITFDRFHVKKLLNKAMDEVRKAERKEHVFLKGQRYLFLKENKNLNNSQIELRERCIELFPTLGKAYRLKELFDDFWTMRDTEEASGFLMYWTDLAKESMIQPMIKFANTIKLHWSGILHFIQSRITNGILEGINSKIQLAKKRARGYRNITNFINMIYFISGKLNFTYPHNMI